MKLNKILTSILLISTLFPSVLLGCGQSTTQNSKTNTLNKLELDNFKKTPSSLSDLTKSNNGDKIVIGFSMDSLKEPVWKKHKEQFIKKAEELGAITRVEQANSDDNTQLSQIDKLIAEGVDVLVVAPHDGDICAKAVEKAHNAGIKIISYDRLIKNSDVDLYIAVDNYSIGVLQAEELLKNISSGNIAYVGGSPTDNNALLFRQGAMDTLEKHKNSINIVFDKYTPNWNPQESYNNVLELLNKNKNIQGILSANDGLASGCIAALEKSDLSKKVFVTGLDADLSACQRIAEGTQLMTVYKPTDEIADKAVEDAISLAKGESPETNNVIFNGKKDIPSYFVKPISVTKDNMLETIIKDNYYKFEDVYKNVPGNQRPKQ